MYVCYTVISCSGVIVQRYQLKCQMSVSEFKGYTKLSRTFQAFDRFLKCNKLLTPSLLYIQLLYSNYQLR